MKNFKCHTRFFSCILMFLLSVGIIKSIEARTDSITKEGNKTENIFRAGAATSNITPFLGGGIVGNFGTPPPAIYIHDELHARCLALDDGKTKLIFIIVDVIGLTQDLVDETKRLILEEMKIPPENVLMSATHTHSATNAKGAGDKPKGWVDKKPFDDYQNFLIRRFVDVVRLALYNMEPASIGWGVGSVPDHVFVRRWIMKPESPAINPFGGKDKVKMNPGVGNPDMLEPASKPDPDVSFIAVKSTDGMPIAILANYSLHYVGRFPKGHISADYFAIFADRIQELLKADRQDPPFVGIMSNGTSGDVTSINYLGPAEKYPPYAKARLVADNIAQEVLRVYNSVPFYDWALLQAASDEILLKVRKPDREMIKRAKYVLALPDTVKLAHPNERVYAQRILQLLEWPDKIGITLQTFRIGDLGVAAIPFETFAETGLEIKAKSPFKPTFTIELANGSYGYLPTPKQHELGGYETWMGTNRVEKEASIKITAKLLELFASFK